MTPHRGDVWWADVPGDKRRPVVILTRERFIPRLSAVLVAPVTTRVRDIPTEVILDADDGMPRQCAVSLDNVLTLPKMVLRERLTRLDRPRMSEVCRAYRFAADCPDSPADT